MHLLIQNIKGIPADLVARMNDHAIWTSDQLLDAACTPGGREELAKRLGINVKLILEFANRADLARVKGIGSVYSDLLEQAGVDTVKELAVRSPENLHVKVLRVISDKKIPVRAPGLGSIRKWIAEASNLPKILEY